MRDLDRIPAPIVAVFELLNQPIFRTPLPFHVTLYPVLSIKLNILFLQQHTITALNRPLWQATLSQEMCATLRATVEKSDFGKTFLTCSHHCEAALMAELSQPIWLKELLGHPVRYFLVSVVALRLM